MKAENWFKADDENNKFCTVTEDRNKTGHFSPNTKEGEEKAQVPSYTTMESAPTSNLLIIILTLS